MVYSTVIKIYAANVSERLNGAGDRERKREITLRTSFVIDKISIYGKIVIGIDC